LINRLRSHLVGSIIRIFIGFLAVIVPLVTVGCAAKVEPNGTWQYQTFTGIAAASGTSPAVIRNSAGGQWIYYVNTDHQIWTWWADPGDSWRNETLNGIAAAPNTSPMVVQDSAGGRRVYYISANHKIAA
jgi:hypothetical protein